ncbi:MAG: uroporphyrinogen-III synthase [Legionellales bacterium]|jgi:uroporphyrinogen-III synthase|nr:uroporphyrinogen-III synthase [Legionellales bacterium]
MNHDIYVLNTRPEKQAKALTNKMIKLGVQVIECPLLKIMACNDGTEKLNKITITKDDILIFTSANAVFHSIKKIQKNIKHNMIIAIGPATQAALLENKISAICPDEFSSSGILKMPQLNKSKNVIIITGCNPKKQLHSCLQAKGHDVALIAVYKRIVNKQAVSHMKTINNLNYILITSKDNLIALNQLLIEAKKTELKTCSIITINSNVRKLAINFGFKDNIIVSEDATDSSLVNCIKDILDKHQLKES